MAHAYLITGPDKVGKLTLAIDMACMVNSDPVVDMFGEAPNIDLRTSHQAERIRKGIHSDVEVIDPDTELEKDSRATRGSDDGEARGRQTISIDHVRQMIRHSATKPFEGSKKVFIFDGAHRMVERSPVLHRHYESRLAAVGESSAAVSRRRCSASRVSSVSPCVKLSEREGPRMQRVLRMFCDCPAGVQRQDCPLCKQRLLKSQWVV